MLLIATATWLDPGVVIASSGAVIQTCWPDEEAEPGAHSVKTGGRCLCAWHSVETFINPNSQKQTSRKLVLRWKTSCGGFSDEIDACTDAIASPSRQ
jgi:hypothetical protein